MSAYETTIIPLDDAHALLTAFGIGPDNREYKRWRRDEGFRWVDLEDVLNTSELVLVVDWREWLQDAVEAVTGQLASLGIALESHLDEDGEQGTISVNARSDTIKFLPADEDEFDAVIAAVNRLIAEMAEFRKFKSCEGSDGWKYGVLTHEQWNAISAAAPRTVALMFTSDGIQVQ